LSQQSNFCLGKYFKERLIANTRVRMLRESWLLPHLLKGRLGPKYLLVANKTAYFATVSETNKKSFVTLSPEGIGTILAL